MTGAIAAATGLAGLELQVAQHAQITKQIREQEELAKLQKQLSLFQIKQFEEAEREKLSQLDSMRGMAFTGGMTTRSMSNAANMQRNYNMANQLTNTAIGPIQRGAIVGTGAPIMRGPVVNPQYMNSMESIDLGIRGALQRSMRGSGSVQSLYSNEQPFMPIPRTPAQQNLTRSFESMGRRSNRSGFGSVRSLQFDDEPFIPLSRT